jgi:nitrogen fixation protein FixH
MRWINWGVAVAMVYVVFAASTLGFVVFAVTHPVQLVSPDYYERSLQHDERADATTRAQGLGERLRVELDAGSRVLAVSVPPEAATGARGAITLYRPSDVHADRTMPLALDAAGRQRLPTAALAHGRWLVRIDWVAGGRRYLHEIGVTLP